MARSANQKLKILYIMDLLLRQSDQEHPIPLQQILEHLDAHNISAERKSIYADLTALKDYGVDILSSRKGYWVASRDFELPELKLLVDSVQSSKFITYKKTLSLIKKLERLGNVHDARQLNRQVYIQNRVKAMNESIYYNVDKLHTAIDQNRQIRFHYFEYNIQKERVLRHDGAWYTISPLALAQDDENYYLVSYDSAAQCIKHFRVDKMTDIQVTKLSRDGLKVFAEIDPSRYTRTVFGMFSGEPVPVKLRFEKALAGAVIDRLGRDVMLIPDGDGHFTVTADVVVSPQFFAWVCGFGAQAKILSPASVVERMETHVRSILAQYS